MKGRASCATRYSRMAGGLRSMWATRSRATASVRDGRVLRPGLSTLTKPSVGTWHQQVAPGTGATSHTGDSATRWAGSTAFANWINQQHPPGWRSWRRHRNGSPRAGRSRHRRGALQSAKARSLRGTAADDQVGSGEPAGVRSATGILDIVYRQWRDIVWIPAMTVKTGRKWHSPPGTAALGPAHAPSSRTGRRTVAAGRDGARPEPAAAGVANARIRLYSCN